MTTHSFRNSIQYIRERLGPAPRRLGFIQSLKFCKRIPSRVRYNGDSLIEQFHYQPFLIREGFPIWGMIIQANDALFQYGTADAPAQMVFSFETSWSDDCPRLDFIAQELFSLKNGRRYGAEEQKFGALLADEYHRALGWKIPQTIARNRKIFSSCMYIHREGLPGNYLANNFLPILAHPASRAIIPIPKLFWPQSLTQIFQNLNKSTF